MEDKERTDQAEKKIHPKLRAGCMSNVFFCWTIPMFVKGYRKTLNEEDLYEHLNDHDSKQLGNVLEVNWEKELKKTKNPSLAKVLIRTYIWQFLPCYFLLFVQELGVKMLQPFCIGGVLAYYDPEQSHITLEMAYLYAGGVIVLSIANAWLLHYSFFDLQHLAMKVRLSCCSIIYRKALKLSRAAVAESTVGQIVNLMGNDVGRFQYLLLHFHHMTLAPFQTLVVLYLLYASVDPAAMAGVAILLCFIPLQMFMGRRIMYYRRRTAKRTDHRLKLMNEIVSGIQVIKMYAWEIPFTKLLELARKYEIKEIKSNAFLRGVISALTMFLIRFSMYLCIITYVLTGNRLQAQYVYVVQAFYGALRQPLTVHLPMSFAVFAETRVSMQRIQTFLLSEEIETKEPQINEVKLQMKQVTVKWNKDHITNTLNNVDFEVRPKETVAIIGPVGSGKTTIFQTILQEIRLQTGTLDVKGRISYASQESWLFSSSIRQNILFGAPFEAERYNKVIQVCSLETDLKILPYGDRTIVGERGVMLSGGQKARVNLARAVYKKADIYLLDDPLSAVDSHVGKELFNECIMKFLHGATTILITHQLQHISKVDRIYLVENGTVTANGTYAQLLESNNEFLNTINQEANQEEVVEVIKDKTISEDTLSNDLPIEVKEHRSTGAIAKRVYWKYFQAGGSSFIPFLLMILFALAQVLASGNDYFLGFWVNIEQDRYESQNNINETNNVEPVGKFYDELFTTENCLYMYSAILIALVIFTLMRTFSFVAYSLKIASILHNKMFKAIVKTSMRFFHTNASGRVLNRFGKDISLIDESLPGAFSDTLQLFLQTVGITIVISIINPWIILPTMITFCVFYCYKVIFLATSRDLKRLESTNRSPVFSHLGQSLQGLATIRAFRAETILKKEFDQHQNIHSSAYYFYMSVTRTFAFWLDINAVIYVGLVILSFLFIGKETYGGNVGLAITQALALTGSLQRGIRQWGELENNLTSVERVLEYTDLTSEPDNGKLEPPKEWPNKGRISFNSVSTKYAPDLPYILKKISFEINPGEKIGIVGRTGAGKSTLTTAMFRLALNEGDIIIDGINIADVCLKKLREQIAIIPQEPVLFSGPLRKNLDPFENYSDEDLWSALQEVELKDYVKDLPGGLSSNVTESGANFSVGQKQLLCLARAIVRNNRILILDEATANVDPQTDELIQATIRRKFKECTLLTIAHRLNTIMDADRILVIDGGECVQFEHPYSLLVNQKGVFYELVQETGKGQADVFLNESKENYFNRI